MSFFFGRKKKNIPSNANFRITQEGREKLQEFSGDHKSQVLMMLETRGTSSLLELSRATGISVSQMERLLSQLSPVYVQYISSAMEEVE